MKILFQGKERETSSASVGEFLTQAGVARSGVLVEYKGEIYTEGMDLDKIKIEEGAELNIFQIVSGG